MTPTSLNHLGARVAPFLMAACLGLELARLSWLAVPEPQALVQAFPSQSGKSVSVPNRAVSGTTLLEGMRAFNPWETVIVEKEKPVAPPPPVVREEVVESKLELNLIGCMILPQLSWAVLTRKKDPNNQLVLQVGEEVDGAFLKKIERNAVYFDNRGRTERIVMLDGIKPPELAGARPAAERSVQASPSTATLGTIARQEYDALVGKGMGLLAGVNVTPYYQGNDSVGYRVKFADTKTEFIRFGLASDDVIRQINGISVTDAQKMGQLAGQLKGLSTIRIDLIRDNQPKTLEWTIGDGS
ncbi:hypothetical protein SIID45300_00839 [Candidatus Magnetaquicoccaceae bacterium FCR-1]|uniref:General secretion pathway protein C n=1 Tax=Candidatus Magnetaquiglobus chichijimensis TaxID=3141448 RepID=A0ABQ0C6L7_9PROT